MLRSQLFLSSELSWLVSCSALRSQAPIPSTPQDGHNRRPESCWARPMVMLYALVPKTWTVSNVLTASPTHRHVHLASRDQPPLATVSLNMGGGHGVHRPSSLSSPLPHSLAGFSGPGFLHSCLQLPQASPGLLSTAPEPEADLSSPLNSPSSPIQPRTLHLFNPEVHLPQPCLLFTPHTHTQAITSHCHCSSNTSRP